MTRLEENQNDKILVSGKTHAVICQKYLRYRLAQLLFTRGLKARRNSATTPSFYLQTYLQHLKLNIK